ncbi:hypothetical protein ACFW93_20885 [Streptomyces canus]|uniref:hypothetical protein n=1 Tax=Streptomyces canus TaxID=58343 RepID=UPI00368BA990
MWRNADGTEQAVLTGHSDAVTSCAFPPSQTEPSAPYSPGTRTGLSAPGGIRRRLWHMATGRCHCALRLPSYLTGLCRHPGAGLLCATGGAGV